jgi:drug/metabolite transporter (DMT)-like permease
MLSSNVVASVVLGVPAALVWMPVPVAVWGLVALLVVSSSARMYADVRSYSLADAGFLAPFAFLRLLFIAAAGWLVFREGIDGPTLAGAAIIVGASVFIAWREAMLKRG